MIIQPSSTLPTIHELIQELQNEFSDLHQFKIFGLGSQKSILVKKSVWVGVQINIRENDILIDGSFPNIVTSSFMTLLSQCAIAPVNKWFELEKEVSGFLMNRYT